MSGTNGATSRAPYATGSHAAPLPPHDDRAALLAALKQRGWSASAFALAQALRLSLADVRALVEALRAEGVVEVDTAVRLARKGGAR